MEHWNTNICNTGKEEKSKPCLNSYSRVKPLTWHFKLKRVPCCNVNFTVQNIIIKQDKLRFQNEPYHAPEPPRGYGDCTHIFPWPVSTPEGDVCVMLGHLSFPTSKTCRQLGDRRTTGQIRTTNLHHLRDEYSNNFTSKQINGQEKN